MEVAPPPQPPSDAAPVPPLPLASPLRWSAVLQKKPEPVPQEAISSRIFGISNSSKGISVAVVDANTLIHGDKISGFADKFVSVKEVLDEVRDPVSRQRLAFLPFPVETMEPSPEFIKKVVKFARETGDLQTLSDVDLKIIALTYMLEAQIHGTDHLRQTPPPLHVVNVKNLAEAEMPGWGSNVPNLKEWEALEQEMEGGHDSESKILPLKDLDNQLIPNADSDCISEEPNEGEQNSRRPRRYLASKKEIKLEGKKMVADGIDASQGEYTENNDDWRPAVSRSTHRRYLRRKARRELLEENGHQSSNSNMEATVSDHNNTLSKDETESKCTDMVDSKISLDRQSGEGISADVEQMEEKAKELEISFPKDHASESVDASRPSAEEKDRYFSCMDGVAEKKSAIEGNEIDMCTSELDYLEIASQSDGTIETYIDEGGSEQSWMLRSLSDSSVACVTGDYAMQNVILQIGLRLLALGGMQIRQLHRWVLKCHACNKVTQEIGRIFCPKCGNGGTLRKVSVTVGENGILMTARKQRVILRGTKFSLPLPQGGREAISKNLILREDQLPHKLLYPKSKKTTSKQDQEFLNSDDIFSHAGGRRAPLKPPVKKALALFSGKRNPNDNHFSRRH